MEADFGDLRRRVLSPAYLPAAKKARIALFYRAAASQMRAAKHAIAALHAQSSRATDI